MPEFEGLQDFCQTFPLYKPGRAPAPGHDPEPVGSFKVGETPPVGPWSGDGTPGGHSGVSQGLFRIYPVAEAAGACPPPRCFQRLPPSAPQECLLRVYIVRALHLSPRDVTGLVRTARDPRGSGQGLPAAVPARCPLRAPERSLRAGVAGQEDAGTEGPVRAQHPGARFRQVGPGGPRQCHPGVGGL